MSCIDVVVMGDISIDGSHFFYECEAKFLERRSSCFYHLDKDE